MYICVCNAIKDSELRQAALACPGDVDAVYEHLGFHPQCGQCLDEAAVILIDERAKAQALVRAPG